jgi:hypothetical protein
VNIHKSAGSQCRKLLLLLLVGGGFVKAQNLRPTFSSKSADIGVVGWRGRINPKKEKKTFAICQRLLQQYTQRTKTHVLFDNVFYGQHDTNMPHGTCGTNVPHELLQGKVFHGLLDNNFYNGLIGTNVFCVPLYTNFSHGLLNNVFHGLLVTNLHHGLIDANIFAYYSTQSP